MLSLGAAIAPSASRAATDEAGWTAPPEPARLAACLTLGPINGDYPAQALRDEIEGVVVERLRFTRPDAPPEISVLENGGSDLFVQQLAPEFEGARLPCMGDAPAEVVVRYVFQLDRSSRPRRHVARSMGLEDFLRAAKPAPVGPVRFDTATMGCPFDLQLTIKQPYQSNWLSETGADMPPRHDLMEWLSRQRLDLGPLPVGDLLGQSITLHVPCADINL